ncbi:MAG: hypothetical protein CMJ19_18990 [Phycisphaeraceae bacterium]|nr:hypothetical protein [Phycisphaeraceae bacterium]
MNSNECKKYLAAFADGELDVDQNLRLLEHMKMDPNATARVAHQQQLRDSVCRCMTSDCPPMPDMLKQSVIQMLEEPSIDEQQDAVIARIRPYQVTAMLSGLAAAVAICLSLFMYFNQPVVSPGFEYSAKADSEHIPGFNDYTAASILPTSQVDRFANRHTTCSKELTRLHNFATNPHGIEEMPKVISEHLGGKAYPCLDLSNAGYKFAGAGPCAIPNGKAAHLIYKSINPTGKNDTISLWITPDDGTLDLVPDKVFRIRGPESNHPIIAWRHDNMVYYIVGDTYTNIQKAYVALNGTVSSGA